MVNEHNQVVCDVSTIILNDGKTLYPHYLEVDDGHVFRIYSNDPRNLKEEQEKDLPPQMRTVKPWDLKNRVEFMVREGFEHPYSEETIRKLEGKHFINATVFHDYIKHNLTNDK